MEESPAEVKKNDIKLYKLDIIRSDVHLAWFMWNKIIIIFLVWCGLHNPTNGTIEFARG